MKKRRHPPVPRPSSTKKRLMQTLDDLATARRDLDAARTNVEMFHTRCKTLEHERNQLRRAQLLARLNMADFHNLVASIATIRTAMEEARVRLDNIEKLFQDPKPLSPEDARHLL